MASARAQETAAASAAAANRRSLKAGPVAVATMGAYKYLEELWKKKQCDVLRYLMRIRA